MYKPFEGLFEILNLPRKKEEDPLFEFLKRNFCEKSWEEFKRKVKPFKEKNLFFPYPESFTKIKKKIKKRNDFETWPPSPLRIDFSSTDEYLEWRSPFLDSLTFEKLKRGEFSVKAVLNLRGLFLEEAKIAFEEFMKEALLYGYNCVLIIHGRGLASREKPVLKQAVKTWLTKGTYRRYVLGFVTARPCDGGAGAIYVLLSSKKLPKKKK